MWEFFYILLPVDINDSKNFTKTSNLRENPKITKNNENQPKIILTVGNAISREFLKMMLGFQSKIPFEEQTTF